jgi:hypothetical protein
MIAREIVKRDVIRSRSTNSKDYTIYDLETVCWQAFYYLRDEWQHKGFNVKIS